MFKAWMDSPWTGAVGCLASIVWEGFWLIGPPLGLVGRESRWYLFWGLVALTICGVQTFSALVRENRLLKSQLDDGRPRFVVEVLDAELHSYIRTNYFFWITNCGERTPRNVMCDPVPSKTGTTALRFQTQPSLKKDKRTPLTFATGADDRWLFDGNIGRLILFFEDNPDKESTLRYDLIFRFLDGERQLEEHHVLECDVIPSGGVQLKVYPKPAAE